MVIEEVGGGVTIQVLVQPRAAKDELAGVHGDAIKIRVAAPPVDGEANEALVKYLAKRLGVSRPSVEIVRGQTGRRKKVRIAGVGAAAARQALGI